MIRYALGLLCLTMVAPLPAQTLQTSESLPAYSNARALREDATLRAVAFGASETGVACGDRGTILRTTNGGTSWQSVESGVDCPLSAVIWLNSKKAVIVGGNHDKITKLSRGVVLLSQNGGKTWQRAADQELTRFRHLALGQNGALLARCDWSHAVLTDSLSSHDGGQTWNDNTGPSQHSGDSVTSENFEHRTIDTTSSSLLDLLQWFHATKIPVAIRGACRITETDYCIVGDHGMILNTKDQGKTWTVVRGQERQTAVLFVANTAKSVAWSMLGSEALESRNRVSLLLNESSPEIRNQVSSHDLANQISIMLGAAGADKMDDWGGDLKQTASGWIAIHQPTVLVLDETLPSTVHDAFINAAASAGVQRVAVYGFDSRGNTALHRDALLPRSGVLASDLHVDAMHYLSPNSIHISSTTVRYPYDISPNSRRGSSVTSGISAREGRQLAAEVINASRHQLQILKARLQQAKRIKKLVQDSQHADPFADAIARTLDQTARADQFRLAWSIVQATRPDKLNQGLALHESALDQFASRFATTSAGRWALLRKQAIENSNEWKVIRSSLITPYGHQAASAATDTVAVSPFQIEDGNIRQVSAVSPLVVPKPEHHNVTRQRQSQQAQVEVDLPWEFHPMVLVAKEAARERGDNEGLQVVERVSPNLKRIAISKSPGWSTLLRNGPETLQAYRASSPPKLDGRLTDACWQSSIPSTDSSVRMRVAYDENFLYVAMQCPSSQLKPDAPDQVSMKTSRDRDLQMVDRVHLSIDTDRDLLTSMQLQVSGSGLTHDAIDGNAAWQPTWYVDTHREQDLVNIEIAIERRDLIELPIPAETTWFLSSRLLSRGEENPTTVVPVPQRWTRVRFQ